MDLPMNEQQLTKLAVNVAIEIFMTCVRPIVLTTKALFRLHMGERYFDPLSGIIAVALIGLACWASYQRFPIPYSYIQVVSVIPYVNQLLDHGHFVYQQKGALCLGAAWGLAFLLCWGEHWFEFIPERYQKGIRWHSRSEGMPRFMPTFFQYIFIFVCCIATYIFQLWGFTALFLFSMCFSILGDAHARKRMWNQVLDVVDAQIESEELGKAVEQRLTPEQASGLNVCVPTYVGDEYRKQIATAWNRKFDNSRA